MIYDCKIKTVYKASFPIITIIIDNKFEIDIGVCNFLEKNLKKPISDLFTNFIKYYVNKNIIIKQFICIIKWWSKINKINGAFNNYPSSLVYVILCIKYLQLIYVQRLDNFVIKI